MLWPAWVNNGGVPVPGRSGFGYGGITVDGGAMDVGGFGVWSLTLPSVGSTNPYTPLPDPGCLEFWYFLDSPSPGGYVGWVTPSTSVANQAFGVQFQHNVIVANNFTLSPILATVSPLSQWHHVAVSWSAGGGFVYLDGSQVQPFTYPTPVGGQHVDFCVGLVGPAGGGLNNGGLVSEAATYRTALSVGDLDAHFQQAELKGQRPHWVGPRVTVSSSSAPPVPNYAIGVTHPNLTGTSSFPIPTALRGVMITIVSTPATHRQLPGNPPYDWDVGWITCSDSNGMVVQQRITRDRQVYLDERVAITNTLAYFLQPNYVINLTELDPA